jgi:hypothetical protein
MFERKREEVSVEGEQFLLKSFVICTNALISRSRVLLEKRIVAELVSRFLVFSASRRFTRARHCP